MIDKRESDNETFGYHFQQETNRPLGEGENDRPNTHESHHEHEDLSDNEAHHHSRKEKTSSMKFRLTTVLAGVAMAALFVLSNSVITLAAENANSAANSCLATAINYDQLRPSFRFNNINFIDQNFRIDANLNAQTSDFGFIDYNLRNGGNTDLNFSSFKVIDKNFRKSLNADLNRGDFTFVDRKSDNQNFGNLRLVDQAFRNADRNLNEVPFANGTTRNVGNADQTFAGANFDENNFGGLNQNFTKVDVSFVDATNTSVAFATNLD